MYAKKCKKKTLRYDYESLDNVARARYLEKTSAIGVDPYELKPADWSGNKAALPSVGYPDIYNYLVRTESFCTHEQMKAYKSLESYNQFVCGWVSDVAHHSFSGPEDYVLVTAKVRHSQKMNSPPLQPWVLCRKNGEIETAHCTCMAGLGEACSHVGAVLFWIDSAVKIRQSTTVTQVPAYWMIPSGVSKVPYKEVKNINFKSAKTLKRHLEEKISQTETPVAVKQSQSKALLTVPPPTPEEVANFSRELHSTGDKAVVLSILPEFADSYTPAPLKDIYPRVLTELWDEQNQGLAPNELYVHCDNLFQSLTISTAQAQQVETVTRDQAKSREWFQFRSGRITASRLKAVCRTNLKKPSRSLLKAICYPELTKFSTAATQWGCQHEAIARDNYCRIMSEMHDGFECQPCGFIIDPEWPHMGATPDALVSCRCCGDGVLEVKCPYYKTDLSGPLKSTFPLQRNGGLLRLDTSHAYYFQVQAQIFVCRKDYSDFVVWTKDEIHIERVEPDEELWKKCVHTATQFFKCVILPELTAKYYTRQCDIGTTQSLTSYLLPHQAVDKKGRKNDTMFIASECDHDE